jgi:hypothetical protein
MTALAAERLRAQGAGVDRFVVTVPERSDEEDADGWLLTAFERGYDTTTLDHGLSAGRGWTEGSLNRRSWSHDSELPATVLDRARDDPAGDAGPGRRFARDLRLRLWREHLDRADGDDADLVDAERGATALRRAAAELDGWYAGVTAGARGEGDRGRPMSEPASASMSWRRALAECRPSVGDAER